MGDLDKRKGPRARLEIYANKYVSGTPYAVKTLDISPQGVRLSRLLEPTSRARRVGLQFQLPGSDEVIYAEGEVVRDWANPNRGGSGVRFTLLTERHRKLIDDYVAQFEPGARS
jgi:hypothetical protein